MNAYTPEWLLQELSSQFFNAYTGWQVQFLIANPKNTLDELWDLFNLYCGGTI